MSEANRLRLLYFLILSATAAWLPVFADDLKGRGFSGFDIGLLLSVTPITMFLVQPVCGMLADRWGYRLCMMVSSLLAAIGFSLFLIQGGFAWVLIATIFMSVFYNTLQPVMDSLTLDLTQRDATFSYGTVRLAGAVGWALTGAGIGYLIDFADTRVIYVYSAAALMAVTAVSFSLPRSKSFGMTPGDTVASLRRVPSKALLFVLVAFFLVSAAATTIWNFYSLYMKENGASASLVGIGISLQGLCEIPFFFFSNAIIKRLGLRNTLLLSAAATAVRLLLYSIVTQPVMALPIEILHGLSWSLFWVAGVEYTSRVVHPAWRATGQSLLYAAYFGIGAIAGNFWTGMLYDRGMAIAQIFFLNCCVVAGIVVFMYFTVRQPGAAAEEPAALPR